MAKSDGPNPGHAKTGRADTDRIRAKVAKAARIVCVVFAVTLALAAFLVAVGDVVSKDNPLVKFVLNVADAVDGPFGPDNGVFSFSGKNAETKNAVVNWGLAAIGWLLVGSLAHRWISPR